MVFPSKPSIQGQQHSAQQGTEGGRHPGRTGRVEDLHHRFAAPEKKRGQAMEKGEWNPQVFYVMLVGKKKTYEYYSIL